MKQKIKIMGYISPVVLFLGLGTYYVSGLWGALSLSLTVLGVVMALVYVVVCQDDLKRVFSARSFRSGTNMLLVICVILSLVVVVNMIGYRNFSWQDVTVQKKYELSPLTMAIIDQVNDKKATVNVTSFFWTFIDRNLSQQQNQIQVRDNRRIEDKLHDLLEVYGDICPNINFRFLDPNRELVLSREYNIQRYRGNVTIVESGTNSEMIADVDTEEEVTNALIKVLSDERRVVYFLEGHQETDMDDGSPNGLMMAATAIRDQAYLTERLNVLETGGVPEDCKVLIIAGPKKPLLAEELTMIDDYLAKGGRIMVTADPEYDADMLDWLLAWGIRLGDDIVVDNSTAGVRQGAGPTEPLLYSYDREHPITKDLKRTFSTMPTVRSIRLETPGEDIEISVLATTSDNSWGERDKEQISVRNPTFDPSDLSGPVPVAVSMVKKLKESRPGFTEVFSGPGSNMPSQEELRKMRLDKSSVRAQLVVFGDTHFASNSYLRYGGNWDLFMNAVNWLIGDERLINIRPKDPEDQTIFINQLQAGRMKLIVQFLIPLIVLLLGAWVMAVRRLR
jgi:gliding motility-associatede transport system auxiliary component